MPCAELFAACGTRSARYLNKWTKCRAIVLDTARSIELLLVPEVIMGGTITDSREVHRQKFLVFVDM